MGLGLSGLSGDTLAHKFTPKDIPGLLVWLQADRITGLANGDDVGTWSDLSGNGKDFTQGTAAACPHYTTNAHQTSPTVLFDGSNDWMGLADFAYSDTNLTVIVLAKFTKVSTYLCSHASSSAKRRWGLLHADGANSWRVNVSSDGTAGKLHAIAMPDADWHVAGFRFAPNNLDMLREGIENTVPQVDATATVNALYDTNFGLLLGGRYGASIPGEFGNPSLFAMVMYQATLTDTQVQTVSAYLWRQFHRPATYYVAATGGSDAAAGSLAAPWLTVQKALNTAEPGDTVYVRTGTYSQALVPTRSGLPGCPITISAYPAESVTIAGGAASAVAAGGFCNYLAFVGITFDSANTADGTFYLDNWNANLAIAGCHYNHLKSCTVAGTVSMHGYGNAVTGNTISGAVRAGTGNGIKLYGEVSHHNAVVGNTVLSFATRGIWPQGRAHDCDVVGNTVHDIGALGIDLDAYTEVNWRHRVKGNTIYNCNESGIELENAWAAIIEENVVYDCLAGIDAILYDSCQVGGETNQYGVAGDARGTHSDCIVRKNVVHDSTQWGIIFYAADGISLLHNTVSGCLYGGLLLQSGDAYYDALILRDNILSANGDAGEAEVNSLTAFTPITTDDYNCLYHAGNAHYQELGGPTVKTLAQYIATAGNGAKGAHSIIGDPLFTNAAAHDYTLQAGSPAKGTASDGGNMGAL
jgi:parallel beta-helix repeat protein